MPSAAATPLDTDRQSIASLLAFHLKVARPGLWLTAMWFYMLPLGGQSVFSDGKYWLGLFYVSLPLGHILYGWNDFVDGPADQLNPRKGNYLFGAKGSRRELATLPGAILLVQLPFALAFTALVGPKALIWYGGLVASAGIYNWPRWGLKSRPPMEVLNQAGYLLVFVISSWLNNVPQLPGPPCSLARCSPCIRISSARSWTSSPTARAAAVPLPRSSVGDRPNS